MSDIIINEQTYSGVNTILVKTPTGGTTKFTEGERPSGTINITENKTYDVTNYASASVNVPTGGGTEPLLQEKTTTENGEVIPDEGYDGLSKVTVNVQPKLQDRTVSAYTLSSTVFPAEGYDGLSSVTIEAVDSSIDRNITPENIRAGVTVLGVQGNLEPDKPNQTKTIDPKTYNLIVSADAGYELASVAVNAVTSSIDANIIPENIKPGVTILGVTGTLDVSDVANEIIATALNTEV